MAGLFGTLAIARRGINASRMEMDVVGNNIANASTEGYSRQKVVFKPGIHTREGNFLLGQGVEVESINRVRDSLVDRQVRYMESKLGYSKTQYYYFNKIEGIFPEPSDYGLQSYMSNFFSELRNLTNNPKNLAVRNTFMQSATTMAAGFNDTSRNLTNFETEIARDLDQKIGTANEIISDIYDLNLRIAVEVGANFSPNGLMDQRDLKIDELSKYMNIQVQQSNDGITHITSGGVSLVRKNSFAILEQSLTSSNLEKSSKIIVKKTQTELNITDGELKGGMDVFNEHLPVVREKLDKLAETMISEVNLLHGASYNLDLSGANNAQFGSQFFFGNSASSMQVNSIIQNDVTQIAISSNGDPGNAEGGLSILNLETGEIVDNKFSLNEYYGFLIANVGLDAQNALVAAEGNEISLTTFTGDRDSVSGISIDEELSHLIRVQRSFESSAKVISTIDRMMEVVTNML